MLVRTGKECVAVMLSITDDKETVAEVIANYLKSKNADEAVFVASSWMVLVEGEKSLTETDELPVPSEHPERREALVLTHVTRSKARMFVANIHRNQGSPPTLGKWSKPTSGLAVRGRFVDAMRIGIG